MEAALVSAEVGGCSRPGASEESGVSEELEASEELGASEKSEAWVVLPKESPARHEDNIAKCGSVFGGSYVSLDSEAGTGGNR